MIESQPLPIVAVKQALQEHSVFSVLDERDLFCLAEECRMMRFKKHQTLIAEGLQSSFLYIILKGSVDISSYGMHLARVGEGALLGEVAAAGLGVATAEVKALETTDTVCLPVVCVQKLANRHAIFKAALHDIAMSRLLG